MRWLRDMAGNCSEPGRSVTSKITMILLQFTEGTAHSLTEIARLTGLPISTTHRLAAELVRCRLLDHTQDGRYRAGPTLRIIETGIPVAAPTLAERAPSVIEDLCTASKNRVRLGVLTQPHVTYIEKTPGDQPATSFDHRATVPAHPTALGRALLAFAPVRTVESVILCGLRPYTGHTLTSPDRFRRALAVTRMTRVAVSRGEFESGVCTVAVPVAAPTGQVIAAIELLWPDHDFSAVMPMLWIAARSLRRELASDRRVAGPAARRRLNSTA